MNKNYLILGLCALLSLAACEKEIEAPVEKPAPEPTDVITTSTIVGISGSETKVDYTAKDDENGNSVFGATWTKDDVVYATTAAKGEDITLSPFTLTDGDGTTTGTFEGNEISGSVFTAVYSKTLPTVTEDKKQIEVLFPAQQTYVEKGLESHVVPMLAVGSDPANLKFKYGSGIVRLKLWSENDVTVNKIEIVTDAPAAGTMLVNPAEEVFPCAVAGGSNLTNMNGVAVKSATENIITYNIENGVALGKTSGDAVEFNIALAASSHCETITIGEETFPAYKSMTVRVYTADGKIMAKTRKNFQVKGGVVHEFPELSFIDNATPSVSCVGSTSTTLTYRWSMNGFTNVADDILESYEVALYKDAECRNLEVSWTLNADKNLFRPFTAEENDAYADFPAFTFTGLTPETNYYFKVKNLTTGAANSAEIGTTGAFEIVKIGEAKVAAGGKVLAEDFSELVWDADFVAPAAGYILADDASRTVFSKAAGANPSAFEPRKVSADHNLYTDYAAAVAATERLSSWDYISEDGSSRAFGCASYLRLGSGSNFANIVTPVLSNLEDGKAATLTVKFKAAPYYDTNKPTAGDPDHIHVAVVGAVAANHKYAESTIGNVAEARLEGTQNNWKEYTLDISGVTSESRIAIGTYRPSGVTGKIRMFLDDVVITVKKYDELKAKLQGATSSTLSFQWSGNGFTDMVADTKNPYTVALYKDAACSELVASWEISEDNANYHTSKDGKDYYFQPAFNFSGLESGKTYYFKAVDTKNNLVSDVVSGTTETFTKVKVEGTVAKGGVVLAEDFSDLVWDGDFIYPGVSYTSQNAIDNKDVTSIAPSTGDTHEGFALVSPSRETSLTSAAYKNAVNSTSLAGWSFNSEENGTLTYGRLGHIKVGAGSYTGRIITPTLSNLEQTATLKVSFKASPYYDHNQQSMIDPLDACIKVIAPDGTETSAHKFTLKDEKNKWNEYSFTVLNVEKDAKISIGTYRASGKAKDCQRRMYIDDIKIEVVEYTDAVQARSKRATSSTLTFEWSPSGFTDMSSDRAKDYTVSLYSDEAFTTMVASWTLPATSELYRPYSYENGAVYPAFIFTGLDTKTTYYFKVDDGKGWVRKAMASTESFEIVEVGTEKVPQGGTLLAEDFSEFVWFGDMSVPAGGYMLDAYNNSATKSITLAPVDNHTGYSVQKCSVDKSVYNDLKYSVASTRLATWGHINQAQKEGTHAVYAQAGHLRLGNGSNTAGIVTPVLSNIEDGKVAKVTVSFKACPYYDSNDPGTGKAVDLDNFHISLFRGETSRASAGYIKSTYGEVEVVAGELNSARNTWKEYSYDIDNVVSTSRIAIGTKKPSSSTDNKARMYLDDIKVVVKEYTDLVKPTVEVQGVTSSALSFKWSVNGFTDAKADYARPARVELYEDADCNTLVVAWNILDVSKYKLMQPAFNFTGLNPNTTYYFKVTDINTGMTSDVASAKTSDFTIVQVDENKKVEVDGTVLAEDFSQLIWDGDYVYPGVGYRTSETEKADVTGFTKATGDNPSGYTLMTATDEKQVFGDLYTNATKTTRLSVWGLETSAGSGTGGVYAHAGYIKLCTSGAGGTKARIVTPELKNLKGTATVKVSFKSAPYDSDNLDACVAVLNNSIRGTNGYITTTTPATDVIIKEKFKIGSTKNEWTLNEFEITDVTPDSRIAIGVPFTTPTSGGRRIQIDEIVITVVSYNE